MLSQPDHYTKKQGLSAFLLFLIVFLFASLHGFLIMSSLPISLINSLNFVFPLLDLLVLVIFLRAFKDRLSSIGLHSNRLKQSIFWGILLLGVQLVFYFIVTYSFNNVTKIILGSTNLTMVLLFLNSAFVEETIYRGYIEARLTGLFRNEHIASIVTAILYILAHYPVKWISSQQFNALTFPHILLLLTLHFTCSYTYRKSGSLWGSVLLHTCYNLANSLIIFI